MSGKYELHGGFVILSERSESKDLRTRRLRCISLV